MIVDANYGHLRHRTKQQPKDNDIKEHEDDYLHKSKITKVVKYLMVRATSVNIFSKAAMLLIATLTRAEKLEICTQPQMTQCQYEEQYRVSFFTGPTQKVLSTELVSPNS